MQHHCGTVAAGSGRYSALSSNLDGYIRYHRPGATRQGSVEGSKPLDWTTGCYVKRLGKIHALAIPPQRLGDRVGSSGCT